MSIFTPGKKRRIIFTVFFLFFTVLAVNIASVLTYRNGIEQLKKQGNVRLELYINYLQGVLGKYESLPELLAIDDNLVKALLNPQEKKRIETLNRYLETINKVSDTLDTYLMNKDGLTIAASNWNESHPFIGRNFNYRPYFKEAMKGKLGRYFALGTTSSKRGYYFAYPVRKGKTILGAVAIKINIDLVEQKWADRDQNFLVSDPDGVIFITTNPQWRYKTLRPLDKHTLEMISESRRYPEAVLLPLSDGVVDSSGKTQIILVGKRGTDECVKVLKQSQFMPHAGWNVHIFSEIKVIKKRIILVDILVGIGLLLTFFFALMLDQRQQRLAEIKRLERDAQKGLQEANEQLESRVRDRTQKLTTINKLLRKEIIDRKETEIVLKRTRKELIHAAKLAALGQMSAGINHELNQPLAAIRSYTDNGKQFLKMGRREEALWNLEQIGELTERMAQIGIQLKLFSKKSSGQITTVPFHAIIDGALEILKPSIKKGGIKIEVSISPENIEVKANHVLLQQVLVNLLANAIQALESQEEKIIKVNCSSLHDLAIISVKDNGPGVLASHKNEIFEPFFTTKKSGQGLGLGLTISDRIVRGFGGKIRLVTATEGAHFEFSLKKV